MLRKLAPLVIYTRLFTFTESHRQVLHVITKLFQNKTASIKVKRVFLTHLKNCTIVVRCFAIDHLPLLCKNKYFEKRTFKIENMFLNFLFRCQRV